MKRFLLWFAPVITAVVVFLGLMLFFPKAPSLIQKNKDTSNQSYKQTVHFVAIGDSLTQGVGDETKRGGFVPLVSEKMKEEFKLSSVQTENYGIAGERSDQILKRVEKDDSLQRSIESADCLTITVGGNDLLQAFQKNLTAKSVKSFDRPIEKYKKNVEKLLKEVRARNKKAPIYVVGIYNPYYLNFPDVKGMQEVVDNWNKATDSVVKNTNNSYFIAVNQLLYKGLASSEETNDTTKGNVKNNVLSDDDRFHPNTLGYQLIANVVEKELSQTKNKWLLKE